MSFKQSKKRTNLAERSENTRVCEGCAKHCALNSEFVFVSWGYDKIIPTIDGKRITSYIDEYGKERHPYIIVGDTAKRSIVQSEIDECFEQMRKKAEEISKLCESYQKTK